MSWKRKGEKKINQNEELVMNPVGREDEGIYICQAENSVGKSEPKQTSIEVLCK